MHEKENDIFMGEKMEGSANMTTPIITTDLGPNNKGSIGPTMLDDDIRSKIDQDISNPEYRVSVNSNEWHCVDGCFFCDSAEDYPGQIAGSIPVSETAAEFMLSSEPNKLSVILATKTKRAKSEGLDIYVHGDDEHGKEGCGANKKLRETLKSNAENIDHVAPRTIALAKAVGFDKYIQFDEDIATQDITKMIVQGGKAAANDELWDVDAIQATDIMVENGAKYEEYIRPHAEVKVVIETEANKTFNGSKYAVDHTNEDGSKDQVFVATLGAYVENAFERGRANGRLDHDIALECYAVIAFQVGVPKEIGNENLEVAILGKE